MASTSRRPVVAVVFGGRSSEHGISCVTAGGVLSAIDRDRFDVLPIGITSSGRWVRVPDDVEALRIDAGRAPSVPEGGDEVVLPASADPADRHLRVLRDGAVIETLPFDVVLPLLHGPYGEDGTIQGALELLDVPYVGCGVLGSAAAQDKTFTKQVLAAAGLPVADGFGVRLDELRRDPDGVRDRAAALGLPLFVKPARAGSSLGVVKVDDLADLPAAFEEAGAADPKIVVERGLVGRELECAVLQGREGGAPRASMPGEVIAEGVDFYDYETKYFGKGHVEIEVPADVTPAQAEEVRAAARTAFRALDLEGLARVDVFLTADGVVVNEVNTMPGMTPFSMFPVLCAHLGMDYRAMVSELIDLALERPTGLR
jgi:D-alanine-D-alanine ligase